MSRPKKIGPPLSSAWKTAPLEPTRKRNGKRPSKVARVAVAEQVQVQHLQALRLARDKVRQLKHGRRLLQPVGIELRLLLAAARVGDRLLGLHHRKRLAVIPPEDVIDIADAAPRLP